jgi:hypothetical protein
MFVGLPQIEVSTDGAVHMEDAAPGNITPIPAGANIKSAFQADLVLLRVRLPSTWAPLHSAAIQMISGVNW